MASRLNSITVFFSIMLTLEGCASKFEPIFKDLAYADQNGYVTKRFERGVVDAAPCSLRNSPLANIGTASEVRFTACQRAMIELSADFCEKKISDGDLLNRIMGWIYVGGGAIGVAAGGYNEIARVGQSTTATNLTDAAAVAAIGTSTGNMKPLGTKGTVKYADLVQAATDYIKTNDWGLANPYIGGPSDNQVVTDAAETLPNGDDPIRQVWKHRKFVDYMSKIEEWARGRRDRRLHPPQSETDDGTSNEDVDTRVADEIVIRQYYIGLFNSIAGVCATSFSSPFVAKRVDVSERSMLHRALFAAGLLTPKPTKKPDPKDAAGVTIKAKGALSVDVSETPVSVNSSAPKTP